MQAYFWHTVAIHYAASTHTLPILSHIFMEYGSNVSDNV